MNHSQHNESQKWDEVRKIKQWDEGGAGSAHWWLDVGNRERSAAQRVSLRGNFEKFQRDSFKLMVEMSCGVRAR